jgi:NADPH-dependent glutamate synthase beta subunit-like oxidoreductase
LGLKGCTLLYRRGASEMPLSAIPADTAPEKRQAALRAREKILQNAQQKFGFRFLGNATPIGFISEGGRLAGLKLARTEVRDGRPVTVPGSEFDFPTPLVVSSIGSIPEPLPGVPMQGELFKIKDPKTGQFDGFPHVFGLGNAVTGKGNIKASYEHGRQVVEWLSARFLPGRPALTPAQFDAILARVRSLQKKAGYDGRYAEWKARHAHTRYESLHPPVHAS